MGVGGDYYRGCCRLSWIVWDKLCSKVQKKDFIAPRHRYSGERRCIPINLHHDPPIHPSIISLLDGRQAFYLPICYILSYHHTKPNQTSSAPRFIYGDTKRNETKRNVIKGSQVRVQELNAGGQYIYDFHSIGRF